MFPMAHHIFLLSLICICSQLISSQQDNGIPEFDWNLCADSLECITTFDDPEYNPYEMGSEPKTYDFLLAIKPYTRQKWLVIFYSNSTNPFHNFTLSYTDDIVFGCEVQAAGVVSITDTFTTQLIYSTSTQHELYCEFIVDGNGTEIQPEIGNDKDLTITLADSKEIYDLKISYKKIQTEIIAKVSCDPSEILLQASTSGIFPVNSRDKQDVSCSEPSRQKLVYVDNNSSVSHYEPYISCDIETKKYTVRFENTSIQMEEPFFAHCEAVVCGQCNKISHPPSCTDCVAPEYTGPPSTSHCAKLECDGNRFLIDDDVTPIVSTPVCISTGTNRYKWSIKNRPFSHASCAAKHCSSLNPIVAFSCPDCETVDVTNDTISCSDGYALRISGDKNTWIDVSTINCNFRNGKWSATFPGAVGPLSPFTGYIQCVKTSEVSSAGSAVHSAGLISLFVYMICAP